MPKPDPAALAYLSRRRSYPAKAMVPPAPTEAEVMELLALATRVPDHGKLEPWRFVLIDKAAMAPLADLAEARARATGGDEERIAKGRGQFDRGIFAVAVIVSPKASAKVPEIEQLLSAGAVCLGLVNAAEAAGWAANWLTGWPAHDPVWTSQALGLAPAEKLAGIIHIASEGAPVPDRPRPDLAQLVTRARP